MTRNQLQLIATHLNVNVNDIKSAREQFTFKGGRVILVTVVGKSPRFVSTKVAMLNTEKDIVKENTLIDGWLLSNNFENYRKDGAMNLKSLSMLINVYVACACKRGLFTDNKDCTQAINVLLSFDNQLKHLYDAGEKGCEKSAEIFAQLLAYLHYNDEFYQIFVNKILNSVIKAVVAKDLTKLNKAMRFTCEFEKFNQ